MRWGDMRPSDNVEQGGGGGGFPLGGGMRLGGGAIILIVIVSLVFGINPLSLLGMLEGGGPVVQQAPTQAPTQAQKQSSADRAAKDPTFDFVRRVTGDTEDVWTALFKQMGQRYEPPRLQVFSQVTQTACGNATAASGPFYCPGDHKVYLDTAFFQQLSQRFGAPGDFAAAYVIAHEVGHHVQNLLGTMDKYEAAGIQRGDPRARNAMSVRLELQADCYAGVWGFYAAKRNLLDPGDVEEGLRAASAVGDDNITKGRVSPDAFTHGSAEQRKRWFSTGFKEGSIKACNTFAAARL
jgi:predicted metalloprotease